MAYLRPVDDDLEDARVFPEAAPRDAWSPSPEREAPLPLFPPRPPAAPFPLDALGPTLSRAAAAIARKVQTPETIAAQSVLAAAALAAQAHADVMLPFGQTRPLSLYFMTVAGSGDRKSTADNEALWPIRKREQALKEEYEAKHKDWTIAYAAWNAEKRKVEGDRKLDFESRKMELAALGHEPEKPLYPFLTAPEPTVEGLLKAWAHAHASLGVFSAEGGQFTGGHGMSSDNRLRTSAAYSELWDGRAVRRIRSLDGVCILDGRRLSLHLMIQEQAAMQFLADPVLRDQGLLSRMLAAAPSTIAGTRFYRDAAPDDDSAIRAYGARILSMLEAPWPLVESRANELQPRVLTMSAGALAAWRAFFDRIEGRCGPSGDLRIVQDFASKAAEHAARIAGVLTIVEDVHAETIGADAMDDALKLVSWYVGEAVRLQSAARADERLLRAQQLLDWLREREASTVDFRDIVRLGPNVLRTKSAADEAVSILTSHGWISEVSARPKRLRLHDGATEGRSTQREVSAEEKQRLRLAGDAW